PEPGGRGAVAGAHGLHRLALAAIRQAPQGPKLPPANRVAGVPEFRGDPPVARVLEHASPFAVLDFPADFRSELKVVAPIVNGPAPVGLKIDSVLGVGDERLERPG